MTTKAGSAGALGVKRTHAIELVSLADVEVDDAFNVRRAVDEARVAELADELARHGQLSPLVVLRRALEPGAQPTGAPPARARPLFLVAGFRRQRAMARLGWVDASAVVLPPETTMAAAYLLNIAENAHSEPIHPSDIARRVVLLHDEHKMAFDAIAAEIGHGHRYLRTLYRLSKKLPEVLRQAWYARHPLATLETLGELVYQADAIERWEQYVLDHRAVHEVLRAGELSASTPRDRTRKRPTDKQVQLAHRALRERPLAELDAGGWRQLTLRCLTWVHTGQGAPEDVLGPLPRRVGRPPRRRGGAREAAEDSAREGELEASESRRRDGSSEAS
jgi:ParB-like chromosome segregation protein Spo0J